MTMERDSLVARLEAIAEYRCPHDLGVDRETGPLGCALDAMPGSSCICAGIVPTVREAAAVLSRPEQVVKALEWDAEVEGDEVAAAETAVGTYSIRKDGERFIVYFDRGQIFANPHDNIEAAGEAAQADHESRIRSRLTTTAPLQPNASAPASPAIGVRAVKALDGLRAKIAAIPKYDRGFSWEASNYRGVEEMRCYGEIASMCMFVLDNADQLLSALHPAPEAASAALSRPAVEAKAVTAIIKNSDGGCRGASGHQNLSAQAYGGKARKSVGVEPQPEERSGGETMQGEMPSAPVIKDASPPSDASPDTAPSPKGVSDGVRAREAMRRSKLLLADLRIGQGIQNERFPDNKIEGALWDAIPSVVAELDAALAALSHEPVPATAPLHGPFGWLNGCRGLSEDSWTLEIEPLENSDEYFAIPLYALTDPFKEIRTAVPATAEERAASKEGA